MAVLEATPGGGGRSGSSARGSKKFRRNLGLVTLIFQNSVLILIMHYSRTMRPDGDHRYFTSTAVFLTELIKLSVCLAIALHETRKTLAPSTPASVVCEQVYNAVFAGDGWKLAVTASFYTLQNLLQYVAIGNLDAVQFQVLYQLKILTTALFSVYLLRRTLGWKRWMALLLLTLGVSIVSLPPSSDSVQFHLHDISDHIFGKALNDMRKPPTGFDPALESMPPPQLTRRDETLSQVLDDDLPTLLDPPPNYSLGVTSILVAAAVSGLTSVYFEKLLKHPSAAKITPLGFPASSSAAATAPPSIWIRNTQMSFYALIASFLGGVVYQDGAEIAVHGFFEGYNWIVWTAVGLQAFGGVVASLVIRDADNIVKTFATSISIVVSFLVSVWLFDSAFGLTFLAGTSLVLFATYLYAVPERRFTRAPRPSPIRIASFEKMAIEKVHTPGMRTPDMFANAFANANGGGLTGSGKRLGVPEGAAISSSRPASPMLPRVGSWKLKRHD